MGVTEVKPGFNGKWLLRHLLCCGGGIEPRVAMVRLVGSYVFNYCLFVILWEQWRFDSKQGDIKASSKSVHMLPEVAALYFAFFCHLCVFMFMSSDCMTAVMSVTQFCCVDHLYI